MALTAGCALGGGYNARSPEYTYGFYNASGAEIDSAALKYAGEGVPYNIDVGVLASGSRKQWSSAPDPIAAKGTVVWQTADGKEHRQDVEVASKVKDLKHFTGIIWLKFTKDGGVEVIPMTYDEQDRRQEEKKHYYPD